MNNIQVLLFIGAFCYGIFLLFNLGRLYFLGRKMDEWQVATGMITKLGIENNRGVFSPDIEYQYSVSGTEYKGKKLTILLIRTYNKKLAQGWIAQYPVGKKVNVFYNPKVYRMAVLEKGFPAKSVLFEVGIAITFIISGGLFILSILYA